MSNSIGVSTSVVHGNLTRVNNASLAPLPSTLSSISCVLLIIALLDLCRLCIGNGEQKFLDMSCLFTMYIIGESSCAEVAYNDCHLPFLLTLLGGRTFE